MRSLSAGQNHRQFNKQQKALVLCGSWFGHQVAARPGGAIQPLKIHTCTWMFRDRIQPPPPFAPKTPPLHRKFQTGCPLLFPHRSNNWPNQNASFCAVVPILNFLVPFRRILIGPPRIAPRKHFSRKELKVFVDVSDEFY